MATEGPVVEEAEPEPVELAVEAHVAAVGRLEDPLPAHIACAYLRVACFPVRRERLRGRDMEEAYLPDLRHYRM